MIKKPYYDQHRENYISKLKENALIFNYLDYKDKNLKVYFYDELGKTETKGYPFSSDFVDENGKAYDFDSYESLTEEQKAKCRLRYFYLPFYHEMYVGTTGSGKTTGCLEPQLRAIASQKNKPNVFLTDPKGELFDHHASFLKKQGYNVFILNFKNPSISHTWNPFEDLYLKQMSLVGMGKEAKLLKCPVQEGAKLRDHPSQYKDKYYLYDNIAFASKQSLKSYVEDKKFIVRSEVSSLANQICYTMIPNIPGDKDPIWRDGSRDLLCGMIMSLLEEAIKPKTKFTKQMLNLKTINDYYLLINAGEENACEDNKVRDFLEDKSSETYSKMAVVLDAPSKTKSSFLSSFRAAISNWIHGHILKLTAETNIDLNDEEKPFAVFFVTRDYESSDDLVASLFINWVYNTILTKVEKLRMNNPKAKVRDTHFLLDEFANVPEIVDFRRKIATARSRNIWFHIIIQNYSQLNAVYGDEVAATIWDNCNTQVFLGCQSRETKEKFSAECGMMTITNEEEGRPDTETVPVVRISDLDKIKPGTMYIKRIYTNVIRGGYIRSYQATKYFTDLYNTQPLNEIAPFNDVDVSDPKRTFYQVCPSWYKEPEIEPEEEEETEVEESVEETEQINTGFGDALKLAEDKDQSAVEFDPYAPMKKGGKK